MTTATLGTKAVAAREAIVELTHSGLGSMALIAEVAERIQRVVPYETSAYMLTDPATHLPMHTHIHSVYEVKPEVHMAYAENEFLVPDFAKMTDIVESERPVLTLRDATGGDMLRSTRHREIHPLHNVGEEMRVGFRSAGALWGVACFTRDTGRPPFSEAEQDFMATISETVGAGIRIALQFDGGADLDAPMHEIPGIVVLREDDSIESITPEAEAWLAHLSGNDAFEMPSPIYHVARAARAAALGLPGPVPRGRTQLDSGAWLLIRATQLRASDRTAERTAIVLEPARRSELAPLIVQLYELSDREREVTELLLRGLPIESIGSSLSISKHTVRDHTKAIFGKLGVSSRPELTAKLFHEHVLPDSTLVPV
jgi:DNA-binding CsgD family transcriptional regulator